MKPQLRPFILSLYIIACLLLPLSSALAQPSPPDSVQARLLMKKGKACRNNPDSAVIYYRMALMHSLRTDDIKRTGDCWRWLGQLYTQRASYDTGLSCNLKALALFRQLAASADSLQARRGKKGIADCYLNLGNLYLYLGNYSRALMFNFQALDLYESLHDTMRIASCYNNIGIVHNERNQTDKALEYYMKTINLRNGNDSMGLFSTCTNIGNIYQGRKQHRQALEFYNRSLAIATGMKYIYGIAACYTNMGNAWSALKDYDKALDYYNQAIALMIRSGDKRGGSLALGNMAGLMMKKKDYRAAVNYCLQLLALSSDSRTLPTLRVAYETLSEAYYQLGDYKKAYDNLLLCKKANDSLFTLESNKQINDLQIKYETEKKEQMRIAQQTEIEGLKRDAELDTIRRILLYAALGILVVLSLLVVLWQRNRIRAGRRIAQAEKELVVARLSESEQQKKLLGLELENKKLELDYKNRELVNLAIHIVEKNEFLEVLKGKMEQAKGANLKSLVQTIDENLLSLEKERKEFDANIELISQTFFLRLRERFPEVTRNEERLSALLRMNLSSKEIAMVLNISPQSVDVYRYKLRKKLGLEEEQSLHEFLSAI